MIIEVVLAFQQTQHKVWNTQQPYPCLMVSNPYKMSTKLKKAKVNRFPKQAGEIS